MNQRVNGAARGRRVRPKIGLVFCEDENDAESLKNLTSALWPDSPRIDYCRKPIILLRDLRAAEDRKRNIQNVVSVVKAKQVLNSVSFVIAHADCDACEPAHVTLAKNIKTELENAGVPSVIPATPAWEMETWWYLWPAAVSAVNNKWNKLKRSGNHGMIKDAKEQFRRDLRTPESRNYEESDSRRISLKVKELGIIGKKVGVSESYAAFAAEIGALKAM